MKALGCTVADIRVMFLTEAATIGLVGGIIGGLISAAASLGMNLLALGGPSWDNVGKAIFGGTDVTRMSIIPWWLFICAVLFSVVIGLIFGFAPANKAVRVPALDAIKNEQ